MEESIFLEEAETLSNAGVAVGIGATMGIALIVCAIAWYVLQVVAYWKIFTKAGKPGWHSIIPLLNSWDVMDLSWSRNMAWINLAMYIAIAILSSVTGMRSSNYEVQVNFATILTSVLALIFLVIQVIDQFKLAKAFGKGTGFGFGLLLLNPIFKLILGFGDAKYQGRQG